MTFLLATALGAALALNATPAPPLTAVPLSQVAIDDAFWAPKRDVWRTVTIAHCLDRFESDGAFANFDHIAAGDFKTPHAGPPFFDGLVYETITGSADLLAARHDAALEKRIQGYVDRIVAAAAADPDGYVNTYTQSVEPAHRWGRNGGDDVNQHDVYNAGCLVEAGVHWYRATGDTKLLTAAVRLANHMAAIMGPAPRYNVIPGHSVSENALTELYWLCREQPQLGEKLGVAVDAQKYLDLAQFWIDARGHYEGRKSFGAYSQDHLPVLEQSTIEGHAVRSTLFWYGVTSAGKAAGRPELIAAARRTWGNMVGRRMYVTGGLGAIAKYEGFGGDYELPNDGYLETCAAVGAGFFHHALNLATRDSAPADELERVLYNGALVGTSLSGDEFFYQNPLASGPSRTRWPWHGCPCCPPMFLKIMGALPGYIYAQDANNLFVNLYVGSLAHVTLNGVNVRVRQTTQYPYAGAVKLYVEPATPVEATIVLRLPAWCRQPAVSVNGRRVTLAPGAGYAHLERQWRPGDTIQLTLPMPAERIAADPRVKADRGRVALQRGPLVYCLEGLDNAGAVSNLVLPADADLRPEPRPDLLGGVTILRAHAESAVDGPDGAPLYTLADRAKTTAPAELTAIPYYASSNRAATAFEVWIANNVASAQPLAKPTLAQRATPTASHCNPSDTVTALNDRVEPASSDDGTIPRATWWDHRGTAEWVQYDWPKAVKVSQVQVYWWDERRIGAQCRVPERWRIVYRDGEQWKPVTGASGYGCEMDGYNEVRFNPVTTTALRLEVQLQKEWSGGVLEWRAN